MIVQLTAAINPDDVEGLYGIHIVERKESRPDDEGCFGYTVGHDIDIQAFHDNMFATYLQSDVPTPGAYALYLQFGFIQTHIGRVTERELLYPDGDQNSCL
jgi:hypothetical protein